MHSGIARLHVPTTIDWKNVVTWLLRTAIVLTAVLHLATGDVAYATFGVAGVFVAFVPEIVARTRRARFPFEVELALLVIIVADMTLGRLLGVYELLPWYDKLLHLGSSFLIAMVAFLAVYVLHVIGHTRRQPWIDATAILLVTLGLGALWEIGEYVVDRTLHRATQGAPQMAQLEDTMFDLMLDGAGGVLAAALGPLFMRYSRRSKQHVVEFTELMKHRPRRSKATH
jgi:hypothetical protein